VVALARQDGAGDGAKLDACLRSDDTLGRLSAEGDAAERATVQGTPAVAVRNNTTGETIMVDGAIDGETLDEAIALMATRAQRGRHQPIIRVDPEQPSLPANQASNAKILR
jgi:predicted DsbA family dithiol-disulfide isomerase